MAFPLPEATPESLGLDSSKLDRACALVEKDIAQGFHPGAQLAVARHGKLALHRSFGCMERDRQQAVEGQTLFLLYSNTKVITAAAVWLLVEDGLLCFGDAIADHIPGFEAHGKGDITVIDLLSHQAGFPKAVIPIECWDDAARLREAACGIVPEWPRGTRTAYHPNAAYGVARVLVEALTGKDFRDVVRARLIEPLGLELELFMSLPPSEWHRTAPMHAPDAAGGLAVAPVEASATFRQAGFAAGGAHGTARAMAMFYQMLARGGSLGATRLFAPRTMDFVTRDFTGDRVDEQIGIAMHRGLGPFSRGTTLETRGLGTIGHSRTFGHSGVGSSQCWADPVSGVSFAFLSNARQGNDWHNRRMDRISNLIHVAILH